MFNKEEIKAFIIRFGEKWFFPDFTNKLTWYVVTLGAGFILVPQPVKLYFINWMIETFNVNSGLELTLPEMEVSTDYIVGVILVFMALAHNIGYKYVEFRKEIFNHKILQKRCISDYKLLESFLAEFPSNCNNTILLKEHDFGNSFDRERLQDIEAFHNQWYGAEYQFIDPKIDQKRQDLCENCKQFLLKVAEYTTPVGASNFSSVIPDHLRSDDWNLPDWVTTQIKELNELATNLFKEHQEFIAYAKSEIQS